MKQEPGVRSVAGMWGVDAPARRGPKPALTVARIVDAAVAVADARGLEAVSMERVAQEFGFTTMALYRYIPSKPDLVALMIDAAVGRPPLLVGPPEAWREKLEQWARGLWDGLHARPWILGATGQLRVMGPNELAWLEAGLAALAPTGLGARARQGACLSVLALVRGMAQFSVQRARPGGGLTSGEWEGAMREVLSERGSEFVEVQQVLRSEPAEHDPLSFGLRAVLDGIGLLVEAHAPRGSKAGDPATRVPRRARRAARSM
jgi:AcrR family transcriptional regulator